MHAELLKLAYKNLPEEDQQTRSSKIMNQRYILFFLPFSFAGKAQMEEYIKVLSEAQNLARNGVQNRNIGQMLPNVDVIDGYGCWCYRSV